MSPPRRRSSRLKGSAATPNKSNNYAAHRLSSLIERDESPITGPQSNLDTIVSSPVAPRTPATAGRIKPSRDDMHPSKVHQSTAKEPDSGLRFGFVDVSTAEHRSSGPLGTPSKGNVSASFDFRFARPAPSLGPEAQLMMDELREEALRIKAKLAEEREEYKRHDSGNNLTPIGGRKIAQPKGKASRFSDIHMAEFKKMDSIAGHPSSFRAQTGRPNPVPVTKSLKRTQSKANLAETEEFKQTPKSLKRSQSKADLGGSEQGSAIPQPLKRSQSKASLGDRGEKIKPARSTPGLQQIDSQNGTPAKRVRREETNEKVTSTKPKDKEQVANPPATPQSHRVQSDFLNHLTTPTQASLARAATVNQSLSKIPSISHSPSKSDLATPGRLTKSVTTSHFSSITRSIFRRNDKSAIPALVKSPSKVNLNKDLPSVPSTPNGTDRAKSIKRVNFTPTTAPKNLPAVQASPSPVKSGIPRSKSNINLKGVSYPSLPAVNRDEPGRVEYPSLSPIRPLPLPPRKDDPPQSVPGNFTFRSDHTISFGQSPRGFGSSPGQASLRQVRPSVLSSEMPGTFPASDKENIEKLPVIAHGMPNKKRSREESDEEGEEEIERSPKKQKAQHITEGDTLMVPRVQAKIMSEKAAPKSKIPSPAKRSILSLSRLNMLARPKNRR